ncbi:hypothetical protein H0H92_002833 [Tricholoma furcatifolium]|nr:hypothetical protein H0H92_002833 [Tricholoma furcatifolium]
MGPHQALCTKCKKTKALVAEEFTPTPTGFKKTCRSCLAKVAGKRKGSNKENINTEADDNIDDDDIDDGKALIKLKHEDNHVPYWYINVPEDIQRFVKENSSLTQAQLYNSCDLSKKAINGSTTLIIQEAADEGHHSLYQVEPIPLHEENGFIAIAFALPEVLCHWGNTNKFNFEVYALLGELYGSGCPLGYLLIKSEEGGETGGKERYILDLLCYFKTAWSV